MSIRKAMACPQCWAGPTFEATKAQLWQAEAQIQAVEPKDTTEREGERPRAEPVPQQDSPSRHPKESSLSIALKPFLTVESHSAALLGYCVGNLMNLKPVKAPTIQSARHSNIH